MPESIKLFSFRGQVVLDTLASFLFLKKYLDALLCIIFY
jgi:hypothetical protein